jgi:hypothetical protein
MTITVTQLYFKGPYAKIEIALARGKKAYDKRQSLKRKEADKEARPRDFGGPQGRAVSAGLSVAWQGGGDGRVVSLGGESVTVRSSKPFAPGSRPEGQLGSGDVLRLKTHRCRRLEQGDAHSTRSRRSAGSYARAWRAWASRPGAGPS